MLIRYDWLCVWPLWCCLVYRLNKTITTLDNSLRLSPPHALLWYVTFSKNANLFDTDAGQKTGGAALVRFAHSVDPLELKEREPVEEAETQLRFVFPNFPFLCQNISACLKLNRPPLIIAYCYAVRTLYENQKIKNLEAEIFCYTAPSKQELSVVWILNIWANSLSNTTDNDSVLQHQNPESTHGSSTTLSQPGQLSELGMEQESEFQSPSASPSDQVQGSTKSITQIYPT